MKTFKISQLFTLFLFTQIGFSWGKTEDFNRFSCFFNISQECRFQIKTFLDENDAKQTIIENCKKEIQNLIQAEQNRISTQEITAFTLDKKTYPQKDILGLCYISANYAIINSIVEGYKYSGDENSAFIKLFSSNLSSLPDLCEEIIININNDLINSFSINVNHLTEILDKKTPALTFFSQLLLHKMSNAIKEGPITLTKQQTEEVNKATKNLTPKMKNFEKNDQLWKASIEKIINNHTTRININTILGATGTILGAAGAIALGYYFKNANFVQKVSSEEYMNFFAELAQT